MKTSVWILGDQLLESHPALATAHAASGEQPRVVLVESRARARRLPYQRKKLGLLFSAMCHYAAELAEQGYAVDYLQAEDTLSGLRWHANAWKPERLFCMAASEHDGRLFQTRLEALLGKPVTVLPNTQFLSNQFDSLPELEAGKRVVMERFYRQMRRRFGLLIEPDGAPTGGRWNYDAENRRPLPKSLQPPERLRFEPDALSRQALAEIPAMAPGVGSLDGFDLAVTRRQALQALQDFLDRRLAQFGPYEDAMSSRSELLFHSQLSPYLNLGLLEPLEVAQAAQARYSNGEAPLASVEGFIRQVIGWREYISWQYWRQMPGLKTANFWGAQRDLPGFFWDADTPMRCLQTAISRALESGYSHHIERLMILCNFCLLAGVVPQQINDWFTACYIDAYEWVMLPNVLGMGLFADGGITATKPYFASANYINKMSDYCSGCRYDPRQRLGARACPYNFLYWNFLIQQEAYLRGNPRLGPSILGLRRIGAQERAEIQRQAQVYLQSLSAG